MPAPLPQFDQPTALPRRLDRGIGIIGAGGIVQYAHLPAYAKAGFTVVGITDADREKAATVAHEHEIPRVYDDITAVLADPAVDIVDIAVYPWEQLAIVEQAAAAGKHILCQKPLSDQYDTAVKAVAIAAQAGVKLAVNQQMRWDAGIRGLKHLLDQGWLGEPTYAAVRVHIETDWSLWPWIYESDKLEIMYHSIHYVDSLRFLLGDPSRVFTSASRSPGETTPGETRTMTIWEYTSNLRALIDVNHGTWQDDRFACFRLEGTEGIAKGTIGLLYDYPTGRPDTLAFSSRRHDNGTWVEPRLESMWIPDAFIGPMASLMQAIENDGEPETSGADNLGTLRAVFAAYQSVAEGRAVSLDAIRAAEGDASG